MMDKRTFRIEAPHQLTMLAKWLGNQELPLEMTVGPLRKKRTDGQNARMWLLHTMAAEQVGCSPEEAHEDALKEYFGRVQIRMPSGGMRERPRRTTTTPDYLQPDAMAQWLTWLENWYGEHLGLWLPAKEER